MKRKSAERAANTVRPFYLAVMLVLMLFGAAGAAIGGELISAPPVNTIRNGDFSSGTGGWNLYLEGGAAVLEAIDAGQCRIKITRVGIVSWGVQFYQDGISLTMGNTYRLSFDAASAVPRFAEARIQKNAHPYTGYIAEEIWLETEARRFSFDFTMADSSDPAGRFVLNLGVQEANGEKPQPEAHDVTVGNFELLLLEGAEGVFEYEGHKNIPLIHVDQLGYAPSSVKKAILVTEDDTFEVCDAATGEAVFSGEASPLMESASAGEMVRVADFSAINRKGRFIVRNSEGESYPFDIRENLYADAARAVFDMFELQKCGVAADAGVWSHDACHTSEAVIYGTDLTKDVTGGWHDAGDYGRYVVPAAKAVTDLLLAGLLTPDAHPGLMDAVRYKLDWMLKMQDGETGAVYHKVSAASFCGPIMPDEETDTLYLSPISKTATGGFAASLALASRLYRDSDPEYAAALLAAAERAWDWLTDNPFYRSFQNPDGIVTGEYPDIYSRDERLWAACELYSATGKDVYHDYVLQNRAEAGLGWDHMGHYASLAYILLPENAANPEKRAEMAESLLAGCERVMASYSAEPYMVSLGMDYPWGSNMHVANNAVLLLIGNMLKPNPAYVEAAGEHLRYLFGRNALSQSYVTGFGAKPPQHPHHRPSEAAGAPVPGMVVGGPNGQLEDPFVAVWLKGLPPAKCYADSDQSYSTNEVTIYWNSPAYLLLALSGL